MTNTNILLVDNRKTAIKNIKKAFSEIEIKHTLFAAESESEAWLMLQGNNKLSPLPKILLIDINSPGINGINLLNTIRNHPELKSILVFVITNKVNDTNKAAALDLNIAGYIPISFESKNITHFLSILNDYWNIIEFSSQKY